MTAPAAARNNRWGERVYPVPVPDAPPGAEVPLLPSVTNVLKALPSPGLDVWKQKQVAYQIATNPDLAALAALEQSTYEAVKQALDKARAASNIGTAAHSFSEHADAGTLPANLPAAVGTIMERYQQLADRYRWQVVATESTVFNHAVGYAGTCDRVLDIPGLGRVIADLKTGKGVYGEMALQLAAYAHGEGFWDPKTETHTALPEGLRTDVGAVIHIPATADGAELVVVDLVAAWPTFRSLVTVRHWLDEQSKAAVVGPHDAPADASERWLWVRARVEAIVAVPDAALALASAWPAGVPTLKASTSHDDGQLNAICEACRVVERDHGLPFPGEDPAAPAPRVIVPDGVPSPVSEPGLAADDPAVVALVARLEPLKADGRLAPISAIAVAAGIPNLQSGRVTPDQLEVVDAATRLVEEGFDPAVIDAAWTSCDSDLDRFVAVAAGLAAGDLEVRFADDGRPLIAA